MQVQFAGESVCIVCLLPVPRVAELLCYLFLDDESFK